MEIRENQRAKGGVLNRVVDEIPSPTCPVASAMRTKAENTTDCRKDRREKQRVAEGREGEMSLVVLRRKENIS